MAAAHPYVTRARKRRRVGVENRDTAENENFYVKVSTEKGRGVFSKRKRCKGEYLLSYTGIPSYTEPDADADDSYIFECRHKGRKIWFDATEEDESFGRLMNDSVFPRFSNVKPVCSERENTLAVEFYALCDIKENAELLYYYGCGPYLWRQKRNAATMEPEAPEERPVEIVAEVSDTLADASNSTDKISTNEDPSPTLPHGSPEEVPEEIVPHDFTIHSAACAYPACRSDDSPEETFGYDYDDSLDEDYVVGSDTESDTESEKSIVFPMLALTQLQDTAVVAELSGTDINAVASNSTDKVATNEDPSPALSRPSPLPADPDDLEDDCLTYRRRYFKNITVEAYGGKKEKRNYSKTDYCLFCKNKYYSKMSKHLLSVHIGERRIQEVYQLPLGSIKRKAALQKLQNEGNFHHNIEVLKAGQGEYVVTRRPKGDKKCASEYVPCEYCLAFIHEKVLWLHAKSCYFRVEGVESEKNYVRNGRIMLMPFLQTNPDEGTEIDNIISAMNETVKNPGLKELCFEDSLIREFGNCLLDKLGTDKEQRKNDKNNIRNKMRAVSRLLLKLNESKMFPLPLNHFICGAEFMDVVRAVKCVSRECDSPNLALTIGHYLKTIALLKRSIGIQEEDQQKKQKANDFLELFEAHWNSKVASVACRTMRLRCINQKTEIPHTGDLIKLKNYLVQEIQNGTKLRRPSYREYMHMANNIIVRIVLFNKRRISEVDELKVEEFENRRKGDGADENTEIMNSLDVSDRAVAKRMELIEVRGKSTRGLRKVFILLTADMVAGIEHLLQTRIFAGVDPNNEYVFGRQNLSQLDGCTAMRNVTESCPGLQNGGAIRSRTIRKYLATTIQIMDMSGDELKMVADHMGHSMEIHSNIYKLQSSILERTKVARALIAMENGMLGKFRGKNLESIILEELPQPTNEDDGDEEEDQNEEISLELGEESMIMSEAEQETTGHEPTKKRHQGIRRKRWSREEESCLLKAFGMQIAEKRNVCSEDIRRAVERFPSLGQRTEAVIRSKINNIKLGKNQKKI